MDERSLGTKGREPLRILVSCPQKRCSGWAVATVSLPGRGLDPRGACRGADWADEGLRERKDRWGDRGIQQRGHGWVGLSPADLGGQGCVPSRRAEVSEGGSRGRVSGARGSCLGRGQDVVGQERGHTALAVSRRFLYCWWNTQEATMNADGCRHHGCSYECSALLGRTGP